MQRTPGGEKYQYRDTGDEAEPCPENRKLLTGPILTNVGPAPHKEECDDGHDERRGDEVESLFGHRAREVQAAVVEKKTVAHGQALARPRQWSQHREVPEEDLQQQRNVAKHFDVDHRQLRDQPVGGKPRDAEDETEDGGEQDAPDGNPDGVQHTHQEGASVGVLFAVGNQGFADAEAGGGAQESESGGDTLALQIAERVPDQEYAHQNDEAYDDYLEQQGPPDGVVPDRRLRRRRGGGNGGLIRIRSHEALPSELIVGGNDPGPGVLPGPGSTQIGS